MRKSTSLTIEEGHIAALDAERDKYTSRSDLINKILDKYYAGTELFTIDTSQCMSKIEKPSISLTGNPLDYPRLEE